MKFSTLLAVIILSSSFSIFITSCQKDDVNTVQQIQPANIESRLMQPAYYRDAKDGNSIQVRFNESQRIYDLPKSSSNYDAVKAIFDAAIQNVSPVYVSYTDEIAEYLHIDAVRAATADEIQQFNEMYHSDADDSRSFSVYKEIVPSYEKLVEIFDYMKAQGCTSPDVEIDYCIPFQYVVDGCYARAHKMKQILQDKYGYTCDKVFSYEGASGSLAVDAGDCCVYWWYHVAPLVKVKTNYGIVQYVMDPSMFDHPVSINKWTGAQENTTCTPWADFGYYEITPSKCYSPGCSTDPNYWSTNWTLQNYADLVTCD